MTTARHDPSVPQIGSDAYFRVLCETLGLALIATDVDLNIRIWNAAAARLFGAAADQMIGTPISQVIPRQRRAIALRMFRRALDTGETIQFEFQHRDDHGARRELAATIAPVLSGQSDRIGLSVCIRDITRRMAMQGELHEARKMVALGEMAGAIAHHFNNILGGMVTSIDFAAAGGDAISQKRVLEKVGGALHRATSLVAGLLAFAEGDQRRDDLADFTEIINELAEQIEDETRNTEIEFELHMPKHGVVPVPRTQVMSIFQNITRNAIEAMPGGGVLRIDVSRDDASLVVLIEDTGCGLDEDAKSRIFEPFWTTKGALAKGTGQATGLGLAIAHGLVQMLSGTISVTSEVGKGSCFRVTLPVG